MKTYELNDQNTMSPEQYALYCDFIAEQEVVDDELIFDIDIEEIIEDILFEVI